MKARREHVQRVAPLAMVTRASRPGVRRIGPWLAAIAVLVALALTAALIFLRHSGQSARAYLIQTLEQHYNAKVQLSTFRISLYPRVIIEGSGLVVRRLGEEQLPPFILIKSFSAENSLLEWLRHPSHVHLLHLDGLEIHIAPRSRAQAIGGPHRTVPGFFIDEIRANGTLLTIIPRRPGKLPITFEIRRLVLQSVGRARHFSFEASLTNPKPPGQIHTKGTFGPWRTEEPSLTAVSGQYTFQNADLSTFKGMSGILSSQGQYDGVLQHISVRGTTDTPDFSVGISGQPVHLTTDFAAVVDGTDGDTYLQPVKAHFLHSTVVAVGRVEGQSDRVGKTISLQVSAGDARIEDLMRLAIKDHRPPLTGAVRLYSVFELPPGTVDVTDRLYLSGDFELQAARFTNPKVQQNIASLSRRARGIQVNIDPEGVVSDLAGQFQLRRAQMSFAHLTFEVPGGKVNLQGNYGLRSERLNFRGKLSLQAKLSQTTHGFKALLLKPLDPLFHKKGAGTVLPIKIDGERANPHFGLDFGRLFHGKK